MTQESILDRLDLFFGEATDAQCRVYARLEGAQGTLSGTITGPHCEYAQTLPATVPLVDRGPGRSLLAETVLPDPCFWAPDLPHLYSVEVQRIEQGAVVDSARRMFGMRRLGAHGRNLLFERKRWVLRGVSRGLFPNASLDQWHQAAAAMLVDAPADDLCEAASRVGVLIVASIPSGYDVASELRRLSRWPAVGIAVIASEPPGDVPFRALAPNLLLAQSFPAGASVAPALWANIVTCDVANVSDFAHHIRECPLPILAVRRIDRAASVADARAQCDHLQADLAPVGDFAGYVIEESRK